MLNTLSQVFDINENQINDSPIIKSIPIYTNIHQHIM